MIKAKAISDKSLIQLRVGIENRVSFLRERCRVDTTPEGQEMWPVQLADALLARREIYAVDFSD